MQRDPASHKGDNGKVAVIGGSRFMHGAPLLSVLAAEASGADLVFASVPSTHAPIVRSACLNVQVHPMHGEELASIDAPQVLALLASMDCAVIGPGIVHSETSLAALREIIIGCPCPMVLDATALQPETLQWCRGRTTVLTPHRGELERMHIEPQALGTIAAEHHVTILLKGQSDVIAAPDGTVKEVHGGNAMLTVGGTGDTMAGLIGGLVAQHMDTVAAAMLASATIKRAAEQLATERSSCTARTIIELLPFLLPRQTT